MFSNTQGSDDVISIVKPIHVTVRAPSRTGNIDFFFTADECKTVLTFKEQVSNFIGLPVDDFYFALAGKNIDIEGHFRCFTEYPAVTAHPIMLMPKLIGGAKVIIEKQTKTKMVTRQPKSEKMALTMVRFKSAYEDFVCADITVDLFRKAKARIVEMMGDASGDFFNNLIDKLSIEQVTKLDEMLNGGLARVQENTLQVNISTVMLKELTEFEKLASEIENAARALRHGFVHQFAVCFYDEQKCCYEIEAFKKKVREAKMVIEITTRLKGVGFDK